MGPLNVSLCMIVRDEEAFLERCLASAAGIVSEIIIVDTGSVDGSREIAKRFGAEVLEFPWSGDFAAARNAGLQRASGQWILVMDADERLLAVNEAAWASLLRQDTAGYYVKLISYVGDRTGGDYVTDYACRLFRNDARIRFEGMIHEEVVTSIRRLPEPEGIIRPSPITIAHDGYLEPVLARKNKKRRNMDIIREALRRTPDDPVLHYALGSEFFQNGHYAAAAAAFQATLPHISPREGYASDLMLKTAYALRETGERAQARRLVEKAVAHYPDFTDLLELQAILLMDDEQYASSLLPLASALRIGADVQRQYLYNSASGSGTYQTRYLTGLAYERMYRWEDAHEQYEAAIADRADYMPVWHRWPVIALLLGRTADMQRLMYAQAARLPRSAWSLTANVWMNGQQTDALREMAERCEALRAEATVLRAVALAQDGADGQAIDLLLPAASRGNSGDALLYVWALYMKTGASREAAACLKREAGGNPALRAMAGLISGEGAEVREEAYRLCQQTLMQLAAWDCLDALHAQLPAQLPYPWLPLHAMYGYLHAPFASKRELLAQCTRRFAALGYAEQLAAGLLALECGGFAEAAAWFAAAGRQAPDRTAPRIGTVHAHAAMAQEAARGYGLPALSSDYRFLSICDR
ncbi:hypothetical protein PAESOLCIP111_05813 [Paenibacillus solanacearum]|uniref:Glycosyltransferase 2-like domain-containing protein n=1 Tax=Paenibacillus solanacearum TaxID=2048548 RepID=A0A916K858_9BACL|nr:TPR domain-containing glycosyltransferase [Paenibacillus solanacearum]CAG7649192.1 hypothetical protein PAESOLCIP111_05813 [Paenibacillus solanacearum]